MNTCQNKHRKYLIMVHGNIANSGCVALSNMADVFTQCSELGEDAEHWLWPEQMEST